MLVVPGRGLLAGVRDLADGRLVERLARDLQPDRQPVSIETARYLDRRKSGAVEDCRIYRKVLGHDAEPGDSSSTGLTGNPTVGSISTSMLRVKALSNSSRTWARARCAIR